MGNQLFQYATGRALALKNNCSLFLDLSLLNTPDVHTRRMYALGDFCIKATLIDQIHPDPLIKFIKESSSKFSELLANEKPPFCLEGYWQCEKYFQNFKKNLHSEINFEKEKVHSRFYQNAVSEIKKSESISIHVRRGDYFSHPTAAAFHGICPTSYYQHGVRMIENSRGNLKKFIFSDDPEWCLQNFSWLSNATVIDSNHTSPAEDLMLMRQCTHQIIANSSFSWWAAWLSNEDGITVAPKKWALSDQFDYSDIVPARWICI